MELSVGVKGFSVKRIYVIDRSFKVRSVIPVGDADRAFWSRRVSTHACQHLDRAFEYQHTLRHYHLRPFTSP